MAQIRKKKKKTSVAVIFWAMQGNKCTIIPFVIGLRAHFCRVEGGVYLMEMKIVSTLRKGQLGRSRLEIPQASHRQKKENDKIEKKGKDAKREKRGKTSAGSLTGTRAGHRRAESASPLRPQPSACCAEQDQRNAIASQGGQSVHECGPEGGISMAV